MKLSDIDSLVHLLQSLSWKGFLFILLVILPLYFAGWGAVFKLLKLEVKNIYRFSFVIIVSFIISFALLNNGIDKDLKLKRQAEQVKQYIISMYSDFHDLDDIKKYSGVKERAAFNDIVERFPGSFMYAFNEKGDSGIQLIDSGSVRKIDEMNEIFLPVAFNELDQYMKIDKEYYISKIQDTLDGRITYEAIERLVTRYPDKFILVNGKWNELFKMVKKGYPPEYK